MGRDPRDSQRGCGAVADRCGRVEGTGRPENEVAEHQERANNEFVRAIKIVTNLLVPSC